MWKWLEGLVGSPTQPTPASPPSPNADPGAALLEHLGLTEPTPPAFVGPVEDTTPDPSDDLDSYTTEPAPQDDEKSIQDSSLGGTP